METPTGPPLLLRIHPDDDVAVVTVAVRAGQPLRLAGIELAAPRDLKLGAKIALRPIAKGEPVRKYGEPIGSASRDIAAGDYVHGHNLRSDYLVHRVAGEGRAG